MTQVVTEGVFLEYPKIETLYNRDPENMRHVIPGELRKDEFGLLDRWLVTEKVDGTNMRVQLTTGITGEPVVRFGGRTSRAQIPALILDYMTAAFPVEAVAAAFEPETTAVLFGEGYGARIQKSGGLYRGNVSFRLFDVAVIGERIWWLNWNDVVDIAAKLGVATVPVLAEHLSTADAIKLVESPSTVAHQDGGDGLVQEGIVARADPLLLMRDGKRMVWKLKASDLAA
jgi:hypothetical protein